MTTRVSIPWLIDDGSILYDVTLSGVVDTESTEVNAIRATDDVTGLEIEIPAYAVEDAMRDLKETARDMWRSK